MKTISILVLAVVFAACNQHIVPSSTPIVNTEIINDKKQPTLLGHCSISSMQANNYKEWFDKSYNSYSIDSSIIPKLQPLLQHTTIEIFLGSWCGDSKREVPRMLKVLHAASFDTSHINIIFVDNASASYKQSPQHEEAGKNIHHVPTFIVYENNKELNRIVETPVASLEKDLLAIVSKQSYQPSYRAINYWLHQVKGINKAKSEEALQRLVAAIKPLCKHQGELNSFGYLLLRDRKYKQAINVFKLNILVYPNDANLYDSLGEAYFTIGNKEAAKKNYEKALELNPASENAKMMLEKLK